MKNPASSSNAESPRPAIAVPIGISVPAPTCRLTPHPQTARTPPHRPPLPPDFVPPDKQHVPLPPPHNQPNPPRQINTHLEMLLGLGSEHLFDAILAGFHDHQRRPARR